jgi:hypothetical protein
MVDLSLNRPFLPETPKRWHLSGTAAPWRATGIGCSATTSGTGFCNFPGRATGRIVGGHKLSQVFAPALFAVQLTLRSQNKEFIELTTLLATILVNWHIVSFAFHLKTQWPSRPEGLLFLYES